MLEAVEYLKLIEPKFKKALAFVFAQMVKVLLPKFSFQSMSEWDN